jgi:hypothetical protein
MQKKDWGKSLRIELLLFKQIMKDILQQEQGDQVPLLPPQMMDLPWEMRRKDKGEKEGKWTPKDFA